MLWIILTIIVSIFTTSIITVIYNAVISPFKREKELAKAIALGHVTTATFEDIKGSYEVENGSYIHVYTYEVNGKKYKRYFTNDLYDHSNIGKEYTWYYRKHPSKAREEEKIAYLEYEWIYIFIVMFIINLLPCYWIVC